MAAILQHSMLLLLVSAASASRASVTTSSSYEAFRAHYRATPLHDDVPYETRLALFEKRRTEVLTHNARPGVTWVARLNRFADFTETELAALRGYRRIGGRWGGSETDAVPLASATASSFLEAQDRTIADSVDWRQQLSKSTSKSFVRDQGACGSCWAVAAVGALEMHAEIDGGHPEPLSHDQLVDCVQNEKHCGGTGGCQGATAELAFEFVKTKGLAQVSSYQRDNARATSGPCLNPSHTSVKLNSWTRLPENKLNPLLRALTTKGPVVVSVDASPWSLYHEGVFSGCQTNATVNHAVVMIGYSTDPKLGKYYLIRNSWGPDWGEQGHIRLQRHDADHDEKGYCGMDNNPKAGVGCDGGPSRVPVCGMCGVLSDTSYPTGVTIQQGG